MRVKVMGNTTNGTCMYFEKELRVSIHGTLMEAVMTGGRFPKGEEQIKKAKKLAARYLKIPEASLQLVVQEPGGSFINVLAKGQHSGRERKILSIYVRAHECSHVFASKDGEIAIVVGEG